jgi:hypothetical protein
MTVRDAYNIVDYGARGNDSFDCTQAINDAIDDARSSAGMFSQGVLKGAPIIVPPGVFRTTAPLQGFTIPGYGNVGLRFIGAGRRSSMIIGDFNGFIIDKTWDGECRVDGSGVVQPVNGVCVQEGENLWGIEHLYIKNEDTTTGRTSGAVRARFTANPIYQFCSFQGMVGLDVDGGSFGPKIQFNEFLPAPAYDGSLGMVTEQGDIRFNTIDSYQIAGIAINNNGISVKGNRLFRCGTGIRVGENVAGGSDQANSPDIRGNHIRDCNRGMYVRQTVAAFIAGNSIRGAENSTLTTANGFDPFEGMLIQNIQNSMVIGNDVNLDYGLNAAWDFQLAGGDYTTYIANNGKVTAGTGAGVGWKFSSVIPNIGEFYNNHGLDHNNKTFATLPSAATNGRYIGAKYNITDCNTTTFGATAAGGGTSNRWVRWNGTNWTVCG